MDIQATDNGSIHLIFVAAKLPARALAARKTQRAKGLHMDNSTASAAPPQAPTRSTGRIRRNLTPREDNYPNLAAANAQPLPRRGGSVTQEYWDTPLARKLRMGKGHSGLWLPHWQRHLTRDADGRRLIGLISWYFDGRDTESSFAARNHKRPENVLDAIKGQNDPKKTARKEFSRGNRAAPGPSSTRIFPMRFRAALCGCDASRGARNGWRIPWA